MSDSQRPDAGVPEEAAEEHDPDAGDGDDLAALSSTLGSIPPDAAADDDDELGSLAGLAGARASISGAPEDKLDLGQLVRESAVQTEPGAAAPQPLRVEAEPAPAVPRKTNWAMPLAIGLGVGVAVGAVMFGAAASREDDGPAPRAAATGQAPAAPSERASLQVPAPATAEAPPQSAEQAAAVEAPEVAAAATPDKPRAAGGQPVRRTTSRSSGSTSGAAPAPVPVPPPSSGAGDGPILKLTPKGAPQPPPPAASKAEAPALAAKQGGGRSVDDLLDEALSPEHRKQALAAEREKAKSAATLPLMPARGDVQQAMAVLTPALRGCAMGQSGLATAVITVRNDGSVAAVRVNGAPFAGTASGRCMEGVVRRAKFPRFRQPTFRVRFPFKIQ